MKENAAQVNEEAIVYIRYEKKYRKWMERLEISVSDEELKKGIEEDGADGYEAEAPDEDYRLSELSELTLTLWPLDFGVLRVYFSVFLNDNTIINVSVCVSTF